jgi:hypothetical protein
MPLNSPREESTFALDAAARQLAMTAERPEGYGARDIYKVDVSRHPWFGQRANEVWAGGVRVALDLALMPKTKADRLQVQIWDQGARSLLQEATPAGGKTPSVFFRVPANTSFVLKVIGKDGELAAQEYRHDDSAPGAFTDEVTLTCRPAGD